MCTKTFDRARFNIVLDILSAMEEPIQTRIIHDGIWMTRTTFQMISLGEMNDVLQQT
jgi:hypothetical protein